MESVGLLPPAVIASLMAAAIACLGLAIAVLRAGWAERNAPYFTAFAAGVLVTAALTLMPEAARANSLAPFAALGGYLFLYAIGLLARWSGGAVVAPMLAIGLHSFIDGMEYGVLFEHDAYVGLVASSGLIAHEFAEGVVLFAALRVAGVRVSLALLGAFIGAAVTTPLGAILSQPLLSTLSPSQMGLVLGGAAGALLYVGATHLPAHMAGRPKLRMAAAYIAGVLLSLALAALHGDLHHDHRGDDAPHDPVHAMTERNRGALAKPGPKRGRATMRYGPGLSADVRTL